MSLRRVQYSHNNFDIFSPIIPEKSNILVSLGFYCRDSNVNYGNVQNTRKSAGKSFSYTTVFAKSNQNNHKIIKMFCLFKADKATIGIQSSPRFDEFTVTSKIKNDENEKVTQDEAKTILLR